MISSIPPMAQIYRDGYMKMMPSKDVVVGDLLSFKCGNRMVADGIIISGEGSFDESSLTGECNPVRKCPTNIIEQKGSSYSSYIFCGSVVLEGDGTFLALQKGINSHMGKLEHAIHYPKESSQSDVQLVKRIQNFSQKVQLIGRLIGFIILLISITLSAMPLIKNKSVQRIVDIDCLIYFSKCLNAFALILSFTHKDTTSAILTFCSAFAVKNLLADNIILRKLEALYRAISIDTLIVQNQGTLTKNNLSVTEFYIAGQVGYSLKEVAPNQTVFDIFVEGVLNNTSAVLRESYGEPEILGNQMEGVILKSLHRQGLYKNRDNDKIVDQILATSATKKRSVFIKKDNKIRLYVQGSSEIILSLSKQYLDRDGNIQKMTSNDREKLENVISDMGSKKFLRTISITYKDLDNFDENKRGDYLTDLTFIGTFGMSHLIQMEVPSTIAMLKKIKVNVICISGDNLEQLKHISKESGLIKGDEPFVSYEGQQLLDKLKTTKQLEQKKQQEFADSLNDLKVVGRATPKLYEEIISFLQTHGKSVGLMTDCTNLALSLKQSTVGASFAIESTEITREASSVILYNIQGFAYLIFHARNAFQNVRRIISHQLTATSVLLISLALFILSQNDIPFTYIQMSWLYLIALILPQFYLPRRIFRFDQESSVQSYSYLMDSFTAFNIIGQTFGQVCCVIFIIFVYSTIHSLSADTTKSLFFNSFVIMTIFNQINSRFSEIGDNIFRAICDSYVFPLGFVLNLILQILFVQFGSQLFGFRCLTFEQHSICFGLGLVSLIIGVIIRNTPVSVRQSVLKLFFFTEKDELQNKIKND